MDLLFRALILGILGSALVLVIKPKAPELGLLLAITVSILLLVLGMELLRGIFDFMEMLQTAAQLSPEMITPVMKAVGIGILTRISADICKDAGQGSIASVVELVGVLTALFVALPLMQTVFQMIGRLL